MELNTLDVSTISTRLFFRDARQYHTETPNHFLGSLKPDEEQLRPKLKLECHDGIAMHDIRGFEDELSLEKRGFELQCLLFFSEYDVREVNRNGLRQYMRAMIAWLKERLAADTVFCIDYQVRLTIS
jgi:hypothetical protein